MLIDDDFACFLCAIVIVHVMLQICVTLAGIAGSCKCCVNTDVEQAVVLAVSRSCVCL